MKSERTTPIPDETAIELRNLSFAYEGGEPVFSGTDLRIPKASRTLLVGANGVGKSTLLQLIAGKHMLSRESLQVFGSSPFFDMSLAPRIALIDGDFPVTVDLTVRELLSHPSPGVDPSLERELIELLEIEPGWRMCRVSDGQRRRVQLLLLLRKPCELLLLDEVTSHLDLVVRSDLLSWLRRRNEESGMTILYTTHILDGLHESRWPTHLAFQRYREPFRFETYDAVPELRRMSLLELAERWIRRS